MPSYTPSDVIIRLPPMEVNAQISLAAKSVCLAGSICDCFKPNAIPFDLEPGRQGDKPVPPVKMGPLNDGSEAVAARFWTMSSH